MSKSFNKIKWNNPRGTCAEFNYDNLEYISVDSIWYKVPEALKRAIDEYAKDQIKLHNYEIQQLLGIK